MKLLGNKVKTIKRYIAFYLLSLKFAIKSQLMYRANFIVSLIVEGAYQAAYLIFFGIVYTRTSQVAGWDANHMFILLGLNTIMSELITAMIVVWNTRELPNKIWNGEMDRILLRPINPLFSVSLAYPYFPSFLSALTGVVIVFMGIHRLEILPSFISITYSILFFVTGYTIVSCLIIIISLMTFFFQDTWTLPRIGERLVYSFTTLPHDVFSGAVRIIFFLIIPVVYVSSFAANSLFEPIPLSVLILSILLMFLFLLLTQLIWKKAVKNYTSASS